MAKTTLKELSKKQLSEKSKIKPSQSRFHPHYANEAFEEQPPIEWTIENFITAGSVNIFEGDPGSKKTWAFLDMSVCVAIGKEWLGRKTTQGTVLIIDEESGNKRLTRRISQVFRGHLAHLDKTTPPIIWTSLDGLNLGNRDDVVQLQILIQETNARLVIIDTLVNVMPGLDENSAKDTQPIFKNLRSLADLLDVSFIVIHHLNKMGKSRGSSAIPGAVDLIVQIESKDKSNLVTFKTTKERDIEALTFYAQANFTPDQFWLTDRDAPEESISFNSGERHILKYLHKHGKSIRQKIIDSAETGTVKNAFSSLVEKGFIIRANDGGQGKPAEYEIMPKGENIAKKL